MKVYVTKYALTKGIYEVDVEETFSPNIVVETNNSLVCYHGKGKEWHLKKEDTIQKAEEMRSKKIESLKKQIEKIENIKFE